MAVKKTRVYILRYVDEDPEDEVYSSLRKMHKRLNKKISYHALAARLSRAKARTGRSKIYIEDDEGNALILEIIEVR